MTSVFVHHAEPDLALASRIIDGLLHEGVAVRRDKPDLGVQNPGDEKCVVVAIWSAASSDDPQCKEYIARAADMGVCVPVMIGAIDVPAFFKATPPIVLNGWADLGDPRWRFVVEEIELVATRAQIHDHSLWFEEQQVASVSSRSTGHTNAPIKSETETQAGDERTSRETDVDLSVNQDALSKLEAQQIASALASDQLRQELEAEAQSERSSEMEIQAEPAASQETDLAPILPRDETDQDGAETVEEIPSTEQFSPQPVPELLDQGPIGDNDNPQFRLAHSYREGAPHWSRFRVGAVPIAIGASACFVAVAAAVLAFGPRLMAPSLIAEGANSAPFVARNTTSAPNEGAAASGRDQDQPTITEDGTITLAQNGALDRVHLRDVEGLAAIAANNPSEPRNIDDQFSDDLSDIIASDLGDAAPKFGDSLASLPSLSQPRLSSGLSISDPGANLAVTEPMPAAADAAIPGDAPDDLTIEQLALSDESFPEEDEAFNFMPTNSSEDEQNLAELVAASALGDAPDKEVRDLVAEQSAAGQYFRDCIDCPDMATLPLGSFEMGAPTNEIGRRAQEGPVTPVALSQPIAMATKEVTFDQWQACVNDGGCNAYAPSDYGWGRAKRPVINVSYHDAVGYAAWLSQKTGHTYRLPSEAEWEFAARAGSTTPFSFGVGVSTALANFNGEYVYRGPEGVYRKQTTKTGSFAPNAYGLFDMHGNVWEWTSDCWRESHAEATGTGAPVRIAGCAQRVLKGGAWNTGGWRLRAAHRLPKADNAREYDNGFRVVREM